MNTEPDDASIPPTTNNKGTQEGDFKAAIATPAQEATRPVEPKAKQVERPEQSSTAPLGEIKPGVDERCMWMDPLIDHAGVGGAVLLGDVIKKYVVQFNLLFDKSSFDEGKLKGASYTMTPAENDAWRFVPKRDGAGDEKVALEKGRDAIGDYYVVPRNSLVYIKLKQKLRLPFYMIGRHNLKIRYVYKGLLLGTGPQVDPGFEGQLFIPLHNFTTSNVYVYISGIHNSFVSIDFVRTTSFGNVEGPNIFTVKDLRNSLKTSKSSKIIIEEKKVEERKELEDYLEGAKPRSQLSQIESDYVRLVDKTRSDYDDLLKDVRKEIKDLRKWSAVERLVVGIAVFGLIVTALGYFLTFSADLKTQGKDLKTLVASSDAGKLDSRIRTLETNSAEIFNLLDNHATNITTISATLTNRDANIENHFKMLEMRIPQLPRSSTNTPSTNSGSGP
jgi:hypothetical protein